MWVLGQWSKLQVSSQIKNKEKFSSPVLCRDGPENLKQWDRLRWRTRASGLISAWQQTESERATEGRQVHDGNATHSCSYLFREVKKKPWKKSPYPLPSPWSLPILLHADRAGVWVTIRLPAASLQLWKTSIPERIDSKKKIRIIPFVKNSHSVCFFAVSPNFTLRSSSVLRNDCFHLKWLYPCVSLVED